MSRRRRDVTARADRESAPRRLAGILCFLGLWTAAVPYLGRILGFEVDVRPWIEVIDHVVPGAVVAALAGWVFHQTSDPRRTRPSRQLAGAGGCILAGIWIFANHLTLLKDAGDGRVAWGAALWHASTSLAIIAASIAYLFAAVEPVESL